MGKDVYVIAEQRAGGLMKVTFELLGKARELADCLQQKVVAVLPGDGIKEKAKDLIPYGADKVLVIDSPILKDYITEPYAKAVTEVIRKEEPEIVLFGATSIGRDLAPRVSARIHTGLTADCTQLAIEEESGLLLMTRPAFGGNIMAAIVCEKHRPQMATVRTGVMKAIDRNEARMGEIAEFKVPLLPSDRNVKICETVKLTGKAVDITEAAVLVAGGRGLRDASGFDQLRQLAGLLGGEVASSRACVDADWIGKEFQVGQTGKTVRPALYLACGISGAIQHIAGMEESETIIAVNRDERAPIFEISDLGIVGDIHVILPKLVQKLKKWKEMETIVGKNSFINETVD